MREKSRDKRLRDSEVKTSRLKSARNFHFLCFCFFFIIHKRFAMPHPGGPGPTVAEGGRAKHCRHGDLGDPGDPSADLKTFSSPEPAQIKIY